MLASPFIGLLQVSLTAVMLSKFFSLTFKETHAEIHTF